MTWKQPLAAVVAIMAAPALANPIDSIRPDAPELAPYGSRPIGVQTLEWVHADQIDIVNVEGDSEPLYDRPLTAEVWYPAADGTTPGGSYRAILRDGKTEVTLTGRAARDAPPASGERYPLIVISHGYPGNRFLMSHLGENLASKGFVTVSIDHTDSTYSDQAAFGATLYHRPIDQRFVVDQMATLDGPLGAIIDTSAVGVIGYSMGGYGALIFGGAGVTQAATEYSWGTPNGLLERHMAGSESHEALIDSRVKAIIAIGPWGRNAGFWDANGLAGLRVPTLLMAGGSDDVSVYATIRTIFEQAAGADRHLLTFEHANHNAAAPIPAPKESWIPVEELDFVPFEHYSDPVWDTTRMNNIAQHFATAFFDLHLKGDISKRPYLELIPDADQGIIALDEDATPTEDHSYWTGFPARTAKGLRFETLLKGE
ncbi:alpha/beta hydrolase family protein [Roseobacter sinensis]|uniref:Dienelactone hydrolase n=1 Tax=Roseobacter sinensis TaxID=2931391 RepID=A0ABT3BH77_9RHOB|nr:dienelactone hydrolase [Roseobacter sp. WL0113]MCV3272929.1 dienelactone hydrolase [Roseobacter sp. WL0113]